MNKNLKIIDVSVRESRKVKLNRFTLSVEGEVYIFEKQDVRMPATILHFVSFTNINLLSDSRIPSNKTPKDFRGDMWEFR